MEGFHVVGGLLRSGSTLLCNILNQNPRFYVSSTSPLPQFVVGLTAIWSRSAEVKSMLVRDRNLTLARLNTTAKAVVEGWYGHVEAPVVFDKSRTWNYNAPIVQCVWPEAKVITIVRDLRSIIASIEKRHVETAILDDAPSLVHKTAYERASFMFGPEGPIGTALIGMEDLLRRKPANWVCLRYEDLCANPAGTIAELYEQLGEKQFAHDFENVKNVAEDVDEMLNLKFPHQGDGPVRPPRKRDWKDYLAPDLERLIMEKFSAYQRAFKYE